MRRVERAVLRRLRRARGTRAAAPIPELGEVESWSRGQTRGGSASGTRCVSHREEEFQVLLPVRQENRLREAATRDKDVVRSGCLCRRRKNEADNRCGGERSPETFHRDHVGVRSGSLSRSDPEAARAAPSASAAVTVCVRVRAGREQGEQRDGDEVAEGRLGPAHLRRPLEPGRIDEEDDGGDHDLGEPADDEKHRRKDDPPEAELGQADGVPEVEDVLREPEDERPEQDHRGDRGDRHGQAAGDERADPEHAQ